MKEIRMILEDLGMEILSMKEAGVFVDVEENGTTFEENALIKATAIAELPKVKEMNAIVLADDSGLEIDYLDKAPGIRSARFAGTDTSYEIKNRLILSLLREVSDEERTARFCLCNRSCISGRNEESGSWNDGRTHCIRNCRRKWLWL